METECNKPPVSILFVEDDELVLALQASIIDATYPDVMLYTAVNGKSGLELFNEHIPDIVITDINMSGMCGVQMSDKIRAIKPDTKIIVITGNSNASVENGKCILRNSDGIRIEVNHYIVKPVDLPQLFTAIEQCISEIESSAS